MPNNFIADPNCVALWKFESGALVTDSIGTNTLTNTGVGEDAVNFKEGACAADFVSTESDYMHIVDGDLNAGFPIKNGDVTKTFTFAFWIKFKSLSDMQVFSKGVWGNDVGIILRINAAGVLRLDFGINSWNIATLVTDRWYHIGIFGDGVAKTATARIWDDTSGIATTYNNTFAGEITPSTNDFVLGSGYIGYVDFLDGLLDEFVVFKDKLTVAEIDLIRAGSFGTLTLVGTIAGVANLQGNITGVSTLLTGTVAAVSSITGIITGGSLQLGTATVVAVSTASATKLTTVGGPVPTVIGSGTGGWAMGGVGVWGGSTPTDTEIPADAEPTGFYFGGGAEPGEAEVISTIPAAEAITAEVAFKFCGSGATGNATTSEPAQDVIEDEVVFALGGAGIWSQVRPVDIPSDALVGTGGFILSGSGFALDPGVTPPSTLIVSTGGWVLGGPRPDPLEVTYPKSADRVIISSGGWEFGGNEGVWGQVKPAAISNTVIVSSGGWILSGSGFSLDPVVTPTDTVIVSTGGWKLGGIRPDPVEVTYPESYDRVIEETVAFEMGGAGVWGGSIPGTTVIISQSAIFVLSGAGGLATVKSPPIAVITGDATGGFVLGGSGWPLAAEVYEAWVLSGQAFEPSVWSAFNFNSFAVKGGQAYACGDAGIYLLGGDHDAGESIQSGARIGPVNFSSAGTKRLRGVVFGEGGPSTRVRVRTDEAEGVFAPDRDTDRVTVSRDLQASEFTVDILNFEELSHLEIFPLRLARR